MKPTPDLSVGRKEQPDRENQPGKRALARLLKIMNLVTINCESALRSSDLNEVARHIASARKHNAIMLRHCSRFSLEQDVKELRLRSVRLESLVSKLEARFQTESLIAGQAVTERNRLMCVTSGRDGRHRASARQRNS
jgi:hypothetical protein